MPKSDKPWERECDAYDWVYEDPRYTCAIRRASLGMWCGYVGVPNGHPFHGKKANDDVPIADLQDHKMSLDQAFQEFGIMNVFFEGVRSDREEGFSSIATLMRCHGGLTYADDHAPLYENTRSSWWFGFDCAHLGDYVPAYADIPGLDLLNKGFGRTSVYRNFEFMLHACDQLAEDLASVHTTAIKKVVNV